MTSKGMCFFSGSNFKGYSPIVVDDMANAEAGIPVTITVVLNDSDPEGSLLTTTNLTAPTYGFAVIEGNVIVYTAGANFRGVVLCIW